MPEVRVFDLEHPTRYCATCRLHFVASEPSPPYAAIHISSGKNVEHLDPVTREVLALTAERHFNDERTWETQNA